MSQDRIKRYSETLPPEQGERVRRIIARHGDRFQTRGLQAPPEGESFTIRRWAEARKSAETGLWSVREYNERANYIKRDAEGGLSNGTALEQTTLLSGACFFDALYACAEFEANALQQDLKPLRAAEGDGDAPHFRAFAKAEGIVFDARNNMPIPVADGQVLIDDCVMDEDALQVVRKSRGNLVPVKPASAPMVQTEAFTGKKAANLPAPVKPDISALTIAQSLDSRLDAHRAASKRTQSVRVMRDSFKMAEAANYKKLGFVNLHGPDGKATQVFKISTGIAVGAGVAAIAMPALSPFLIVAVPCTAVSAMITMAGLSGPGPKRFGRMIADTGYKMPEKRFIKSIEQVRRVGGTLPADDMRAECAAAANHAEFGFRILSARHAFIRALDAGALKKPFARAAAKREMGKFVAAAKSFGVGDDSISVLVEQIQNEPKGSYFDDRTENSVRDQFKIIEDLFRKAGTQVAPLLPKPGI